MPTDLIKLHGDWRSDCYQEYISFSLEDKLIVAGLGGSVGCAVRLETRRSRVQPPPRSATFFRGD